MKSPGWTLPLTLVAVLTACGASPPLHYYALESVQPVGAAAQAGATTLLRIRHISLPPEMDHRGLTHHVGPNQLNVSDNAQWSASLGELIQGTLTRDLGQRLGFEHVIAPGAVAAGSQPGPTQAALDLDFIALSADETCGVSTQVNWALSTPGSPARRGSLQAAAAGGTCPEGLPAALSTVLGALADQLAQRLP